MTYALVDDQLKQYVEHNRLGLLTVGSDGKEARFFYKTNQNGNCYQVSIEQPKSGRIKIHLFAIESEYDDHLHIQWNIRIENFSETLKTILSEMENY